MARIDLMASTQEAIIKLADGNPGAVVVLLSIVEESPWTLIELDMLKIYGPAIWELFKDVCFEDRHAFITEVSRLADQAGSK